LSCSQYCLRGGWDFAGVRYGESLQQDMAAIPIDHRQRFVVVASPEFVQRHGRPASPRALAGMPCIGVRFPSGVRYRWEFVKEGKPFRWR
jgi:DNA-binding transcriptional LysR family regulator